MCLGVIYVKEIQENTFLSYDIIFYFTPGDHGMCLGGSLFNGNTFLSHDTILFHSQRSWDVPRR